MGLDKKGRDYLTYRPIYGYTPIYTLKPFKETILPEYIPSNCIKGLTNVIPSSILREIMSLLENLTLTQRRLEQCIAHQKAAGVTFTQYKHELESPKPDYKLINQWENFQRISLNGTIQGETYRYIADMLNEFESYSEQLNTQVYGVKSNLSLDKKLDIDKQYINDMIHKDAMNLLTQGDITIIGVKTQLNHIAIERVINAQEYLKGLISVCSYTLNDKYNGNIDTVLQGLADTSLNNLRYFNHLSKVIYKKQVAKTENDRLHAMNMNSSDTKTGMNKTLFNISNTVINTRQLILDWAGSLDSHDDNGPMTYLIEEIVDRIEFLDEQYAKATDSLAGLNRMDKISKQDIIDTLRDKKTARMLVNLVDAMIRERERDTFDLDKFIQKNKLLEPGNMCTN